MPRRIDPGFASSASEYKSSVLPSVFTLTHPASMSPCLSGLVHQALSVVVDTRQLGRGDLVRLGATCRTQHASAAAALHDDADFAAAARICRAVRRRLDSGLERLVLEARRISAHRLDTAAQRATQEAFAVSKGWVVDRVEYTEEAYDDGECVISKRVALPGGGYARAWLTTDAESLHTMEVTVYSAGCVCSEYVVCWSYYADDTVSFFDFSPAAAENTLMSLVKSVFTVVTMVV